MTKRVYSEEIKKLAKKLFKQMNGNAKGVALEMGLNPRTVQLWAAKGHWRDPLVEQVRNKVREEVCADATERISRIVGEMDKVVEITLGEMPDRYLRSRAEGAKVCHDLAKARTLITGKADGEGTGQEFTIRTLIFAATGSDPKGNIIQGSIKDTARPPVLLARGGEKIEAECRTAEGDDGKEKV